MVNAWSLKRKLTVAFTGVALGLLVVGGVGLYTMDKVTDDYSHIVDFNLPNTVALTGMRGSLLQIRVATNRLAIPNLTEDARKEIYTTFQAAVETYQKNDKKFVEIPMDPEEQKLYEAQNAVWKKSLGFAERIVALAKRGNASDALRQTLDNDFQPTSISHFKALGALIEFQNEESSKWVEKAKHSESIGGTVATACVILGFILAQIVAFALSGSLSGTLTHLASKLNVGAEDVARASRQIAEASSELSSASTEQAAALQETVASVDEISAMVNRNADNAKKSQELSQRSHETALRGKQAVEAMIQSIDDIQQSNSLIMEQIEHSNREISEIVKVISDIGEKTKVINDIVFQTKLLSFNASVEAARAGEHGKGFAVVAEEVGNLAQMSGNAAKEISQMLDSSIQKVEGIVRDTKGKVERLVSTGKEKVENGTKTARNCGEVLDAIVVNVGEVNQIIAEISLASAEQSEGVQEITKAMAQLDQGTQQNTAASQQAASSGEALTAQAADLRNASSALNLTIHGGKGETGVTPKKAAPKPTEKTKSKAPERKLPEQPLAKVIPLRAETPALKPGLPTAPPTAIFPMKKAAGAEDLPSENDPRFEDV